MSSDSRYEYGFDPEAENDTAAAIFQATRPGGPRVLDLGSGPGIVGGALATKADKDVTCLDLRQDHLDAAADRGVQHTIQADLRDSSWIDATGDKPFDVIILADVLEHLVDPTEVLVGIRDRQLLTPGGYLVVSIPNVAHESILACLAAGEFPYQPTGLLDHTHLRFFTRTSFQALLEEQGFTVTRLRRITRRLEQTRLSWVADRIDREALSQLLRDHPDHRTFQFVMRAEPMTNRARVAQLQARLEEQTDRQEAEVERLENELQHRDQLVQRLSADLSQLRTELADTRGEMETRDEELRSARRELDRLRSKLREVYASETWQVGDAILGVPKAIKRWIERSRQSHSGTRQ